MSHSIARRHTTARMSKSVSHNGVVHLCGQTATGSPAKDITSQTHEVLSRIDTLLAEAGSSRSQLLSAVIYLKSITDFAAMNAVWGAGVLEGTTPARTIVEARLASDVLLVEITVTAAAAVAG